MSFEALKWAWNISLKPGPKLVLIRLADMADNKGGCWPKQSTIAKDTGLSRSSVSKHIKELEKLGFIEQTHKRNAQGWLSSSYYILSLKTQLIPCLETRQGETRQGETRQGETRQGETRQGNLPQGETEHHRVANHDNKNHQREPSLREDICKVSDETSRPSFCEDVPFANTHEIEAPLLNNQLEKENQLQRSNDPVLRGEESSILEVFGYWQAKMNHPRAKFDQKRQKKIQAAFKLGFSLDQLKQAIDGCKKTKFNMGENKQRQIYDGIGLIFRDAEQIERFIRNAATIAPEQNINSAISQMDQILEGAI